MASVPSPQVQASVPPIDGTFGASFIGVIITAMLYGITNLQTYFYYVNYPSDRVGNKSMVAGIWVLDTLHTILVSVTMYHYLITNFANPKALLDGHWALFTSILVNCIIAFVVHSFFLYRIFQLCGRKVRWWLSGLIAALTLAHLAFGIETVIFLFIKKQLAKLSDITLFAATPFAIFAVLADIAIAASLVVLLRPGMRTGFRKTQTLVSTLIIYSINRCILTSVIAVAEVIAFAVSPHSLWFLAMDFVVGKLYANSLLASLNSRNYVRGKQTVQLSDMEFDSNGGSRSVSGFSDAPLPAKHIQRETNAPKGLVINISREAKSDASRSSESKSNSFKRYNEAFSV